MFFKRRSSRSNSYAEHDAPPRSQSFDEYAEKRPDSSRKEPQPQSQQQQPISASPTEEADMYPRAQQAQETAYPQAASNGPHNSMPIRSQTIPAVSSSKPEPMPDLLAQAFNQAIRPYTEKIEQLESQLADMQAWVDQLEQQRAEVHNWIDKRGLRPGMLSSSLLIAIATTNMIQMFPLPSPRLWTLQPPMLRRRSMRNSTAKSPSSTLTYIACKMILMTRFHHHTSLQPCSSSCPTFSG